MEAWEVTLDDALELMTYWSRTPPLRELVSIIAQLLGWEPGSGPVEGDDTSGIADVPGEFED